MTQFAIPPSKKIFTLDLENLGGNDEYSQTPLATRSPDMKNIINRLGMHQVRESIAQTYIINKSNVSANDDKHCDIKWIGKIEEYDDLGNPIPYYVKISEYLGKKYGEQGAENDSYIYISVWPSPDVRNIQFDMSNLPGYENYRISYKKYTFTNYGETGNSRGLYEEIEFDGKTYVFTPIGILSFDCSTDTSNNIKTLNFEVHNVNDDPYVPTIIISSSSDSTAKKTFEAVNILTNKRRVQFLGEPSITQYQLPEKVISGVDSVKVLSSNGQYTEVSSSNYSVNNVTGTITFGTAVVTNPVPGKDNLIVEYSKSPVEGNETNEFNLNTSSTYLTSTVHVTKATNQSDSSKIDVVLSITVKATNKIDSTHSLRNARMILKMGNSTIHDRSFTSQADINAIISNAGLTYSQTLTVSNDGATSTRNWTSSVSNTVRITTTTTTTTGVPGSVGTNTSLGRKYYAFATYLGLSIDARAVPHLGTKSDGSDSYWDVYASPRLYTQNGGYLDAGSRNVSAIVDGSNAGSLATGSLQGSGTWPSSGEVYKRIPYSSNKKNITVAVSCYVDITFSGVYYGTVTSDNYTLNLPAIQPPTQQTITNTTTSDSSESANGSYSEGIKTAEESTINYGNDAKTSARLACYYSTKATTVYGYENDRRVFVTNGTNVDTFSGRPVDPNYSTITYFPDVNYNVLGEESNILGYAQKSGYLFTVKEGSDSLYVRKGSIINDELVFPSIMVRRNIQILCRPIEIDGNIYIITRNGLEEIGFDYVYSYTYELMTYLRSYYVSNYFKLGSDYKYKQMEWFNESGLLHIYLDNYEFVFDLNSKSYVKDASSSLGSQLTKGLPYQFEAYVCTIPQLNANLYAPKITVYLPKDFERAEYGIVNEDIIPFGYNNTGIYKLSYSDYKVDKLLTIRSNEYSVFSTENTYDIGDIVEYNGSYYICTKPVDVPGEWTGLERVERTTVSVGDDLSGKTLYFEFPREVDNTGFYEILSSNNGKSIDFADNGGNFQYINLTDESLITLVTYHNYVVDKGYPLYWQITLSDYFGIVTHINEEDANGIFETITADYERGNWQEYNIEQTEWFKYYPIKSHYFTPFLDFDTTTQLKTIKQLTINTTGHNGDEYYIGYVLPDGTQLLIDKIINTANDEQTFLRNGQTPFPKIISIKNKIRKFSNCKLFVKNKADYLNINEIPLGGRPSDYSNMTFNRITLKYVDAGKYRGD